MKVSDYIVSSLLSIGVKRVYTLTGGFAMYLNDSIGHSDLVPVYMLHESGAVFSALADAQYTGELGVCCVTAGPGSTNVLTGVVSAWVDGLPLLVISGDVMTKELDTRDSCRLRQVGPQDAPIMNMIRGVTKYSATVLHPDMTDLLFHTAIEMALRPRKGPVWLDIPLDVQSGEIYNVR